MSLDHRWNQFLATLRTEIHASSMNLFENLSPVDEDSEILRLSHGNQFMAEICARPETNAIIHDMVSQHWPGDAPKQVEVLFKPLAEGATAATMPLFERPSDTVPPRPKERQRKPAPQFSLGSPLNRAMTFNAFISDNSNEEAFYAAERFARLEDATHFNPLYIHGQTGTGKTHLLHAIGNHVNRIAPERPVLYFTGDEFVHIIIDHIRARRVDVFRSATQREGAVVIVDDVQLLSNKTKTIEELFNLFNWHRLRGAFLAFASDLPPSEIPGLSERLSSRMAEGLVMTVSTPLFETRVAIAQACGEEMAGRQTTFAPEVFELVADVFNTNVRELKSAVRRLLLRAELKSVAEVDLTMARELLSAEMAQRQAKSPEEIARIICEQEGVSFDKVRGKGRTTRLVQTRMWICGLLREETTLSLVEVGKLLSRDHSTVHHSLGRYDTHLETPAGQARREALRRALRGN